MAALGLMLSACQNNFGHSMVKAGEITKETAVVENKLNDGILIAYLTADSSVPFDMEQESTEGRSVDYIEEIAYMIQEVTGGTAVNIDGENRYPEDYGTVFLGVTSNQPQLPEALRQFLEKNDLNGKTIIPFYMTNEEYQETILDALYEIEPEAEFLDGFLLNQAGSADLEQEIDGWLSELGYNR